MFKPRINENKIGLYDVYVQRIMHEGELFWSRFKIYLCFHIGLAAVFGIIVQSDVADFLNIQNNLWIIVFICLLGIIFSVAWILVNYNGRMWLNLMRDVIIHLEEEIFSDINDALYFRMNEKYHEKIRNKCDVVNISISISWFFLLVWVLFLILGLFYYFNHMITTYPV